MGKGLRITNTHGWTVEFLQAQEKAIEKASIAKRVMTIRLLMQGYYVKKFNEGGMEGLLHRKYAPGRCSYLLPEEVQEIRRMLESSTPAKEGDVCQSCCDMRILREVIEDRFSVTMSRGGIRHMLNCRGFSYTRPTYTLKRANKEALTQQLETIKKRHR